jgi:hypothetical protein
MPNLSYEDWFELLSRNTEERVILERRLATDPTDAELRALLQHNAERNAVLIGEHKHHVQALAEQYVHAHRTYALKTNGTCHPWCREQVRSVPDLNGPDEGDSDAEPAT